MKSILLSRKIKLWVVDNLASLAAGIDENVKKDWDEWDVVAVLNYGDEPLTRRIELSRIGLEPDAEHVVWEFWNEQYLGVKSGTFDAIVPPRSARLYRLARRTPHPWLLSTDMHTLQGQVEIEACHWEPETMTLSGKAVRPKGERGNVFLTVPPGLALQNPAEHWIAKDAHDGSLIVRRELRFDDGTAEWETRFARIEDLTEKLEREQG